MNLILYHNSRHDSLHHSKQEQQESSLHSLQDANKKYLKNSVMVPSFFPKANEKEVGKDKRNEEIIGREKE